MCGQKKVEERAIFCFCGKILKPGNGDCMFAQRCSLPRGQLGITPRFTTATPNQLTGFLLSSSPHSESFYSFWRRQQHRKPFNLEHRAR